MIGGPAEIEGVTRVLNLKKAQSCTQNENKEGCIVNFPCK